MQDGAAGCTPCTLSPQGMKGNYDMSYWITKNGDVLLLEEMTDSHLINAYKMVCKIEANLSSNIEAAYSFCFQGEMAQYAQEIEIDRMEDKARELMTTKEELAEEIKKRDLQVQS